MGGAKLIDGGVWVLDAAFHAQGLRRPNPFTSSLDAVSEAGAEYSRLLCRALGELEMGERQPEPQLSVPQHDGRVVCATAFGAPYPTWDPLSASWWLDAGWQAWPGLQTAREAEEIPIPDWSKNPLVCEMAAKWREVQSRVGAEQAAKLSLPWTSFPWTHPRTGQTRNMSVFMTFVDLGGFLLGSTRFLTMLAAEPELAAALMRKCFELSVSYSRFMDRLYGKKREGVCTFGGDNSCLLSPAMYRAYAMGFDRLLAAECPGLWRNLHSCGPSSHLYALWGKYPDKDLIVLMQTRAIPGAMRPLRKALPSTVIQLTVHQPQFDFERARPDRVKALIWELAEAMEFRDGAIGVLVSSIDERVKANIRAFNEAIQEVNAEAQRV